MTLTIDDYIARAKQQGISDAENDLEVGNDRTGEDVIADTEVLVFSITGRKLHEFDEDEEEEIIVKIVEEYDEAYIDAYVSGFRE